MALTKWTNCYALDTELDTMLAGHIRWEALSDAEKEAIIVAATLVIDRCARWTGAKADSGQALQFPRDTTREGWELADQTEDLLLASQDQVIWMLAHRSFAAAEGIVQGSPEGAGQLEGYEVAPKVSARLRRWMRMSI